eukprot:gene9481-10472_t
MADDGSQIKLLTIGDSGVGKSWLLLQWSGETSRLVKGASSLPTIGIDFKMKSVMVDGKRLKVQVWDTAGQERFRTITTSYYRNSQGILLVYDITDRNTFNNIRNWVSQIQLHADVNVNKILIGNKCDLTRQRVVTFEEGENLAKEFGIPFFETSAMNNINVDDAFLRITKDVHSRMLSGGTLPGGPGRNQSKPVNATKPISAANVDKPRRSWC